MRAHTAQFILILWGLRTADLARLGPPPSPPESEDGPPPIPDDHEEGDPLDIAVNPGDAGEELSPVEVEDVEGAIRLSDYFKSHSIRAVHEMTGGLPNPDAVHVLEWIKRGQKSQFRVADVAADLRRFRRDASGLADALQCLVEIGAIRPILEAPKPQYGRKPSPMYEARPGLI
jgi:hypothetical protein